jgi:hypothetical protein
MHFVLACRTNHTFFFCHVAHIHLWFALLCYVIWFDWASSLKLFLVIFFCGYLLQADVGVKFQPSVASALHDKGLLCLCLIMWKTGGDNGL